MPNYPYTFQLPPLNLQDIPSNGAVGEFLGISAGGVLDWLPVSSGGSGDMLAANNLSELTNFATARTNIGLGTASTPTFANLTLTSPSLSSSAPVTISQTWNNAAVAFTGLRFNAAGTSDANSAAASKLLEFQIGGVSKFSVDKYGITTSFGGFRQTPTGAGINVSANGSRLALHSNNAEVAYLDGSNFIFNSTVVLGWSSTSASSGGFDTALVRDGAGQLALRNGAAAQTFRVYGAYPDTGINYARLALSCDTSGNATISTQALGTYTAGTVSINGVPVGRGKQNLSDNIGIGFSTLNSTSSGNYNTALGYSALQNGSGQDFNVAVGNYTLFNNNGDNNVAIGIQALWQKTTGARDTAIGSFAGTFFAGGSPNNNLVSNDSVFIGADTKPLASGETNQIVIGYNTTGIGSNSVVLGNDSITKTALKGNVGIGTTNPTSNLQLYGNSGQTVLEITSVSPGTGCNFILNGAFGQLNNYVGPLFITNASATDPVIFRAGGQIEKMRITAAGNVGIGTTAPGAKLHVAGNGLFGENTGVVTATPVNVSFGGTVGQFAPGNKGNLKWDLYNDGTTALRYGIGMSANLMEFQTGSLGGFGFYPGNTTTSALHIITGGNVGIGTTSPTSKLHVAGELGSNVVTYDSGAALRLTNTTTNSSWLLTSGIIGVANGHFSIRRDSVALPALIIAGITDNVGIGITTPTAKLHVAGTIKPEQATMVDKAAGFTLAAVDAGTVINSTSATAITINLPAADTAAGYNVMIIQSGAGAVTIAANGNTLNSFGSAFTTAGQHAACSIVRTAASTYNLSGNLV